jgi:phage-related protein
MRQGTARGEKPLHWVGPSRNDLLEFPAAVVDTIGWALSVAQFGATHPSAKPWKGEGTGIFELVESFDGNAYRAVYAVRFSRAVYVLHCFQKKSPRGIATARTDVDLVRQRLRAAGRDYEDRYAKAKERR